MTDESIQSRRRAPRVGVRSRPHDASVRRGCDGRRSRRFPAMAERRPRGSGDPGCDRKGNFPPRKALKTHKMRKESRFRASPPLGPAERVKSPSGLRLSERRRGGGETGDGNFPPRNALKTHEMRQESRF